jgi:hypothetical protein
MGVRTLVIDTEEGLEAISCEYGNGSSGATKSEEFLDEPSNCYLPPPKRKHSVSWSSVGITCAICGIKQAILDSIYVDK